MSDEPPAVSEWSNALPAGGQPLVSCPVAPRTFEIALALAGAVSAGAYIAGILDRVFEAMDDWEARKTRQDPGVPDWTVTLKVLSGSSAGGICASIAALAADKDFAPATSTKSAAVNPFHHAWVSAIDIVPLLGSNDRRDGLPASLLDASALDAVLAGTVTLINSLPNKPRAWISPELKVLLTTCNLDGVAYRFAIAGVPGGFYASCVHADVVRFARSALRPDELPITATPGATLLKAALATAAFPIGLATRDVDKPADADAMSRRLDWRATVPLSPAAGTPSGAVVYAATVDIGSIAPIRAATRYPAMDGGSMDNEPMELARLELAGALGRSPRDGATACRAVILVDPLVEMPGTAGTQADDINILNGLGRLLTAYKNGARASATNIALAASPEVYSRFLISPFREVVKDDGTRGIVTGPKALAGAGLEGFLGFFGIELRQHDFELGRANAEHFLRHGLRLPVTNPLFGGETRVPAFVDFEVMGHKGANLPIIPLFGPSTASEPPRPAGQIDLKRLRGLIRSRVGLIIGRSAVAAATGPETSWLWSLFLRVFAWPARWLLTGVMTEKALAYVRAAEEEMRQS